MKTRPFRVFQLGEFAVVVVLVSLLAALLLSRVDLYRNRTEEVAVRHMLAALRMALRVEAARAGGAAARLAGANPMAWLDARPVSYLGEVDGGDLSCFPPGNWVFDRRDKTLVYISFSKENFTFSGSRLLRFKVELSRSPRAPGAPEQGDASAGLTLDRVGGADH